MKRLITFLPFLPYFVSGCLKVNPEEVCPTPQFINSNTFENPYNKYLSQRNSVLPNMAFRDLPGQNCVLEFNCNRTTDKLVYFMMFRDNGPPVFLRRFWPGGQDAKDTNYVTEITRDKGEGKDYRYRQMVVDNPTFACQEEDNAFGKCQPITTSGGAGLMFMGGFIDHFKVSCPTGAGVVLRTSGAGDFQLDDENRFNTEITCVQAPNDTFSWYYEGRPLGTHIEATCAPGKANNPDACASVKYVEKEDEAEYDPTGFMKTVVRVDNYTTTSLGVYGETFKCAPNLSVVFFSWHLAPIVPEARQYQGDGTLRTYCQPSPLATSYDLWDDLTLFALGQEMPRPGYACFDPNAEVRCPIADTIDQAGVRNNVHGAYLGNRPTFKPTMRAIDDKTEQSCIIGATCDSLPDEFEVGYLMMFRDNGPPVFLRRIFPGGQKRNVEFLLKTDFTRDKGSGKDYRYRGTIVDNPKFACQAEPEYAHCSQPGSSGGAKGQLAKDLFDIFTVQCPTSPDAGIFIRIGSFSFQIDDETSVFSELTCVGEGSDFNWYYNSILLGATFTVECVPNTANKVTYCRQIHYVTADLESEYGASEFMATVKRVDDYNITSLGTYGETFSCGAGLEAVLFSWTSAPLVPEKRHYQGDGTLRTICAADYLKMQYGDIDYTLYSMGQIMPHLGYACFDPNAEPEPEMICPEPVAIDQAGIRNNAYGKYLGNRATFKPQMQFVDDSFYQSCVLVATCSNIPSEYQYGYLMMFRDNGPPVYVRRFFPGSLTRDQDIHFAEIERDKGPNKDFRYRGVLVDNPKFACQAEPEYGKCREPTVSGGAVLEHVSNLNDVFKVQCPSSDSGVFIRPSGSSSQLQLDNEKFVISDLTCVGEGSDFNWYFNGVLLGATFEVECVPNTANKVTNCRQIQYVTADLESEYGASEFMATVKRVDDYKITSLGRQGETFSCGAGLEAVLFSWTSAPLIPEKRHYQGDGTLRTVCALGNVVPQYEQSAYYLYALGQVMPHLGFACFALNV